jgi:hypothetical protein
MDRDELACLCVWQVRKQNKQRPRHGKVSYQETSHPLKWEEETQHEVYTHFSYILFEDLTFWRQSLTGCQP